MDRSTSPAASPGAEHTSHLVAGAVSGLLAASVALGVGELVAAFVSRTASPLIAVGETFIDLTPEPLKTFAIDTFGSNDKLALLSGISVTLAIVAMMVGALATRRLWLGWLGVGLFGAVGMVAALTRPTAQPLDALPSLVGAVAGIVALTLLVSAASGTPRRAASSAAGSDPLAAAQLSRRGFVLAAAGTAVVAGGAYGLGRVIGGRSAPVDTSAVPIADELASAVPKGADLRLSGLSPFYTPTADFYRVDTALVLPVVPTIAPSVSNEGWTLTVHGMVDHPLTLTYADLLARDTIERDITLTCVSNQVGGRYVGNARWVGVPLRPLLQEAGVRAGADQIVSRSYDGMSIGTPTAVAMDGRDAMIAVAMNGEHLPPEHGYPARLLVPGLYGYVSATKWLKELELTTFDAFDAYWVQRGWAQEGPIKTMSRIDTPRPLANLAAGRVAVAGVAWAQHRGVAKVEVRVDGGPWAQARLADIDTYDTWRQWVYAWDAVPGRHLLEVRATDGLGAIQPEPRSEPFPDGATGWHSTVVMVA